MKRRVSALSVLAACLLSQASAHAHALLINPVPLTSDDNAKSGPCGCYFGAGPEDPAEDSSPSACPGNFTVTDLVPGSKLQVTWKETVQHTGKFRVAFSDKQIDTVTRADMDQGVLYEGDDTNSNAGGLISATITVPNKPCQNCVLQFRQYMETASTPYYYSCAAVNVVDMGSSSSGGASSSSGGMMGTGGSGGAGGGGELGGDYSTMAGPAPIEQTQTSGYCSVSLTRAPVGAELGFFFFALSALALRRRASR